MSQTCFTASDAQTAYDTWGANCGPGALAAILGLSLDDVRPALAAVRFERRRYTSPAMMYGALRALGADWRKSGPVWPDYGLARVQWEGPWTKPGARLRERFRQTHWIGVDRDGVFDINCIGNGSGWVSRIDWQETVVPWLVEVCVPGGDGGWHLTRTIEIKKA